MSKEEYYQAVRVEVLPFFNSQCENVLEVGCGYGGTLHHLKKNGLARQTFGIDINEDAKRFQKEAGIDQILIGDVEDMDLDYPDSFFDAVLLMDVLEHLREPQLFLTSIKKHLKKDGFIVASIPTIRNAKVLYNLLLKGDFKYEDDGILDRTHLRFFTKKTMIRMFNEAGFKVDFMDAKLDPHPVAQLVRKVKPFFEMGVIQYVFKLSLN